MREPLPQPDAIQQRLGAPLAFLGGTPGNAHRHAGVLERGEFGEQVVELEHEADVTVAEGDERVARHRAEVRVADANRSAVDRVEPAEDVQQRALADARGADDRHHLARLDEEIEAAQHRQRRRPHGVALVDAGRGEHAH